MTISTALRQQVKQCINLIVENAGNSLLAADALQAIRAGYQLPIDYERASLKTQDESVDRAITILVRLCRNGLNPAQTSPLSDAISIVDVDKSVVDPKVRAWASSMLATRISEIKADRMSHRNTTTVLNKSGQQGAPKLDKSVCRYLYYAFIQDMERLSRKSMNPLAKLDHKAREKDTFKKRAYDMGLNIRSVLAGGIAAASAMSSYAFAQEYYKFIGLPHDGTLGKGDCFTMHLRQDADLAYWRHYLGHAGGAAAFVALWPLLLRFDLERIRNIVSQASMSTLSLSMLRKVRALFVIDKRYVFEEEFHAYINWSLSLVASLTTMNSPFLSLTKIADPVLRTISVVGSYFSALLGNANIIESYYARPLNRAYRDHVLPKLFGFQGKKDKLERVKLARTKRKKIRIVLKKASQVMQKADEKTLRRLLKGACSAVGEPFAEAKLFSVYLHIGTEAFRRENIRIEDAMQSTREKLSVAAEVTAKTAIFIGSLYALSTCIKQGRQAVSCIFNKVNSELPAGSPQLSDDLISKLGLCAGFSSLSANVLYGYGATLYVVREVQNFFKDLRNGNVSTEGWLTTIGTVLFQFASAMAQTVPLYQVAKDHAQIPGAEIATAVAAWFMAMFSMRSFSDANLYYASDVPKLIQEYANGDASAASFEDTRTVIGMKADEMRDYIDNMKTDMAIFLANELEANRDDSVAPIGLPAPA